MPVKKGHNGGGIYTLRDLMWRCDVDPFTDCWNWKLALTNGKYVGPCITHGGRKYKTSGVRAALLLSGIDVPDGMTGYHYKCQNTLCCNPDHMRVGTHAEKWAHIKASGMMKGDLRRKAVNTHIARNRSKLQPHIDEIRSSSETTAQLAERLNCCTATIRAIRAYRTHKGAASNTSVFTTRRSA